jgi:hypothetical protein
MRHLNLREMMESQPRFDYLGPLAVRDIAGKGKGLVETADVPMGSLLLAETAFALSDDVEDVGYDVRSGEMTPPCYVRLVSRVVEAGERCPNSRLYSLYADTDYDRGESVPVGVVDTARIERICNFNAFACENELLKNCVSGQKVLGLWITASFVNHSCAATAERMMVGDVLLQYSVRDIAMGEEVTVSYVANELQGPNWDRGVWAARTGIDCDCLLCRKIKADSKVDRKAQLRKYVSALIGTEEELGTRIEIYGEAERIYGECLVRPLLGVFALDIAQALLRFGQLEQAEVYCELSILHSRFFHLRLWAYLRVAEPALKSGNRRKAVKTLTRAFDDVHLLFGLDFDTFLWLDGRLFNTYWKFPVDEFQDILREVRASIP